jgi:hypothetical protein
MPQSFQPVNISIPRLSLEMLIASQFAPMTLANSTRKRVPSFERTPFSFTSVAECATLTFG